MLLIDAGNTSITLACGHAGEAPVVLGHRPRPRDPAGKDALRAWVADGHASAGGAVAISSVVPDITALLRDLAPDIFVVDHLCDLPFGVAVSEPAAVGADRWCNVAAAAAAGWRDALVVDAGTATTFDVLRDGVFVGGLIAPGLALAAEALGARAARLPEITLRPRPAAPAPDTVGAMEAGAFQAGTRGVWGVVAALRVELGDGPLVLTGGLAPLLVDPLAAPPPADRWRLDPIWSLRGLAVLAARAGL